jgi:hypothetical protein
MFDSISFKSTLFHAASAAFFRCARSEIILNEDDPGVAALLRDFQLLAKGIFKFPNSQIFKL